jgi:hypothetical protein
MSTATTRAHRCATDGEDELAGAGPEIHHDRADLEYQIDQKVHLFVGSGVLFVVVLRNMHRIQVLAPGGACLVEQPTRTTRSDVLVGHRPSLADIGSA